MKLTLVTTSLACGGAERAVVSLAEEFVRKGHCVDVVTLAGIEHDFYTLPEGVHRVALDLYKDSPTPIHAIANNLRNLWILRKTICSLEPNIIISVLYVANVLTLLSLAGTCYPIFVNEQNNPSTVTSRPWKFLRRFTYPFATKVVSVSRGVDTYFDWLPRSKRAVIYNPLKPIQSEENIVHLPEGMDLEKKWILAMGRLVPQKNFHLLLSAFRKIADKYPDWQLIIFGEGELRQELEKTKDDLGFGQQVLLPGIINNPFPILKKAKLFVMSSSWEGLPLVLLESMACGLPAISTDCPSGPSEVIRDGIDGRLVPNNNAAELARVMSELMSHDQERERLATNTQEGIKRFSLEKIVETWEELINVTMVKRK